MGQEGSAVATAASTTPAARTYAAKVRGAARTIGSASAVAPGAAARELVIEFSAYLLSAASLGALVALAQTTSG